MSERQLHESKIFTETIIRGPFEYFMDFNITRCERLLVVPVTVFILNLYLRRRLFNSKDTLLRIFYLTLSLEIYVRVFSLSLGGKTHPISDNYKYPLYASSGNPRPRTLFRLSFFLSSFQVPLRSLLSINPT